MNKISQIRQEVLKKGTVTLDTDDFNQLQAEWIKRAGIEYNPSLPESREELDQRLSESGLLTISQILDGTPMDAMHVCAEVVDLDAFEEWLKVNQESFLSMKARLEVGNRQDDEMYEWVLSHSAVFHSVMLNFKAAVKGNVKLLESDLRKRASGKDVKSAAEMGNVQYAFFQKFGEFPASKTELEEFRKSNAKPENRTNYERS